MESELLQSVSGQFPLSGAVQSVPPEGALETILKTLTDYGAPWVVVALLAYVCWRLFLLYTSVQEKRVEEAKAGATLAAEVMETMRTLSATVKAFMQGKKLGTDD